MCENVYNMEKWDYIKKKEGGLLYKRNKNAQFVPLHISVMENRRNPDIIVYFDKKLVVYGQITQKRVCKKGTNTLELSPGVFLQIWRQDESLAEIQYNLII